VQFFFAYLVLHGFLLLGAIVFRKNSLAKTILTVCFLMASLIYTWTLSLKIVCSRCFDSAFSFNMNSAGSDEFLEPLTNWIINYPQLLIGFVLILYLQTLYLGYMFMVDYET
jgi:hypothetical protein|tara:strand:- start:142 stop:477 length:336 start_codon:yes stop_codon:yes gene_type:complete